MLLDLFLFWYVAIQEFAQAGSPELSSQPIPGEVSGYVREKNQSDNSQEVFEIQFALESEPEGGKRNYIADDDYRNVRTQINENRVGGENRNEEGANGINRSHVLPV